MNKKNKDELKQNSKTQSTTKRKGKLNLPEEVPNKDAAKRRVSIRSFASIILEIALSEIFKE